MDLVQLWNQFPIVQVLTYLGVTMLAAMLVRVLWRRVLPLLTSRTKTTLDERIAQHTATPVAVGAMIVGLWMTAVFADRVDVLHESGLKNLLVIFKIASIFAGAFIVNGVIQALFRWYAEEVAPHTDTQLDDDFLPLIRRLVFILVLFIATAMSLREMGKDITALVATASVASLAVALAAQDTLSNMISGFMIMLDRPFRVGDRIEFRDGKVGDVLEIGMRSTRILSVDNHVLVVPNKDLASDRIINHKLIDPRARLVQRFSVAYHSDVARVKEIVLEIAGSTEGVLDTPAPMVLLLEFGDSGLQMELRCWVDHYLKVGVAKDAINMAIKSAFERHGIEFPFPQRQVHVVGGEAHARLPGVREAAAGKE